MLVYVEGRAVLLLTCLLDIDVLSLDPYLNLFRGLIPPLFGLDFSPILAFFLLSALGNATTAVGCEIPPQLQQKLNNNNNQSNVLKRVMHNFRRSATDKSHPSMNY